MELSLPGNPLRDHTHTPRGCLTETWDHGVRKHALVFQCFRVALGLLSPKSFWITLIQSRKLHFTGKSPQVPEMRG